MSKGKRRRRPSGHPARVAAWRERTSGERGISTRVRFPNAESMARVMRDDADKLDSRLGAELWASQVLGQMWEQRHRLPPEHWDGYQLALGAPVLDGLPRIGGVGAKVALAAIQCVDNGELGMRAAKLAREMRATKLPDWFDLAADAEIVAAAIMREPIFDDGKAVLLEAQHADGGRHATVIYIDHNLGGIAKHIHVVESIDKLSEAWAKDKPDGTPMKLEWIDAGLAADHIYSGIELTDQQFAARVSEEFAKFRAFALCRADEITGPYAKAKPGPEMTMAARRLLVREFLDSPEGKEFAADSLEATAVRLAIDFSADCIDGRPLRWSPTVVELFMAYWMADLARQDPDLLDAVPAALDAWIRFSGRRREIPQWAIDETSAVIPEWRAAMKVRARDPTASRLERAPLTLAYDADLEPDELDVQNDPGALGYLNRDLPPAAWN